MIANVTDSFGARATVYIGFDGQLPSLGNKLSKCLMLPSFYFDTDQDPPHEKVGMCETLGFEIWIKKSIRFKAYPFLFEIETTNSLNESFNDKMFDLSLWLARHTSELCEFDTYVFDDEKQVGTVFHKGKTQ